MACGFDHTLVLTSKNEVFGMGKNNFGQLGFDKSVCCVKDLTLLNIQEHRTYDYYKPIRIYAGLRQSYVVTYCERGDLGNEFIFASGKTKEIGFSGA